MTKYCVDCKFYLPQGTANKQGHTFRSTVCMHPDTFTHHPSHISLVTGETVPYNYSVNTCEFLRKYGDCKPEGLLFSPKPAPEIPKKDNVIRLVSG